MNHFTLIDPWAIVALLASLLIFCAAGYFMERARARRAERLNGRYKMEFYYIEQAVDAVHEHWRWDATSKLSDKVAHVLTQGSNAASELASIDNLLKLPALEAQKTRFNKIAFAIGLLKGAARGEKVSNRPEDYR